MQKLHRRLFIIRRQRERMNDIAHFQCEFIAQHNSEWCGEWEKRKTQKNSFLIRRKAISFHKSSILPSKLHTSLDKRCLKSIDNIITRWILQNFQLVCLSCSHLMTIIYFIFELFFEMFDLNSLTTFKRELLKIHLVFVSSFKPLKLVRLIKNFFDFCSATIKLAIAAHTSWSSHTQKSNRAILSNVMMS